MKRTANKEMNTLIRLLVEANIPFEVVPFPTTYENLMSIQICCPSVENCRIDAVSHGFSYGGKQGFIETMSDMRPDVDGWLDAAHAFEFFKEVWDDERGATNG